MSAGPARSAHMTSWNLDGIAVPTGIEVVDRRIEALQDVDRGVLSPDDLQGALDLDARYGDLAAQLGRPTRSMILFSRDGSVYRRGPRPGGTEWACVLLPAQPSGLPLLTIGQAGHLLGITPSTIGAYVHAREGDPNPFPIHVDRVATVRLWLRWDLFAWHAHRPGNGQLLKNRDLVNLIEHTLDDPVSRSRRGRPTRKS